MDPLTESERKALVEMLKRRVVLTEDLRAFHFMKTHSSSVTPFSGVFVPRGAQQVYPIKGRFFITQQADTMKGFVDNLQSAKITGSITVEKNLQGNEKLKFDLRMHWPNLDYTTIGVKKASEDEMGGMNRLGELDGDGIFMTFPFYHSIYQVGTDDGYVNSAMNRSSLCRLAFPKNKEAVMHKIITNLSKYQAFYKNISVEKMATFFGLSVLQAQDLAYCALKANVVNGSINQVENFLTFGVRKARGDNRELYTNVQNLVETIRELKTNDDDT